MTIRRAARWQLGVAMAAGAVALLTLPISGAAAVPSDAVGSGTIAAEFGFTPSVPPLVDTSPSVALDNQAVALSWSILKDLGSVATYVDDKGLFYAGTISIGGSGTSPGESITEGGGSFNVSVSGSNIFGGTLNCPSIGGAAGGSYIRVGVVVVFAAGQGSGTCYVDGQPVPVAFQGAGIFQTDDCNLVVGNPPSTLPDYNCPYGNGITTSVARTKFDGAWTILSAENP
jgi:hypothetical protein